MVYRSMETVNVEEYAMSWCRLSQVLRVTARRLERQNDRLDELVRSGETLRREMQARAIVREAQTAATWGRVAQLKFAQTDRRSER